MKLIDFHTHTILKPLNSCLDNTKLENLWKEFDEPETCLQLSKSIQKAIKSTDKKSQADFTKISRGSINGIFFAMGPAERPFFDPHIRNWLIRWALPKKDYKKLARSVTGFCMDKVDKIFQRIADKKGVDYFNEELQPEFQYLLVQEKISHIPNKFKIARSHTEFKNITDNETNTVAVILTVEGAHSFGKFDDSDFTIDFNSVNTPENIAKYSTVFLTNIRTVKQTWGDYTPFFVTLCHHFWNLLSGHSKSMSPTKNFLKPGMDAIIDQSANMDKSMTEIGKLVIKELLNRDNGRRILIDVKHMSSTSRKWYYNLVKQKRVEGDSIPIICSHTSVNLYETMEEASALRDTFCKDKNAYLSRFSINLSNDEIREIADSKGIIGIILNEGRMPGELGRKAIEACGDNMDKKRDVYLKLIMCNILQIVKVVNKKEGWDMICIGSDFDGVIDPFETYENANTLKDLPIHIMQYLSNPKFDLDWVNITANDIKANYMFGYTAQEIAEKISYKNVMLFLEKYFHDGYLKNSSNNENNIIP